MGGEGRNRLAREYSELFRELVMKPNPYMNDYELMMILMKMKIFQLGLSVMVANGLCRSRGMKRGPWSCCPARRMM
ncbi:hypothetical protein [Paenibacillus thiaminolyticus]|uniref:hypothetical protein n=1 Tax=Paenibacillus thiaminolyticus TaxID=49283 RepID=UPI002542C2AF|nr:hypothetical protein [Paenibacillus thiaminolyticus]WII36575.1 hypothetical protein O0V01_23415 [Paenibacillus thiaminolyticus]